SVELFDRRIREDRGVELRGFLEVVVEPERGRDGRHLGAPIYANLSVTTSADPACLQNSSGWSFGAKGSQGEIDDAGLWLAQTVKVAGRRYRQLATDHRADRDGVPLRVAQRERPVVAAAFKDPL